MKFSKFTIAATLFAAAAVLPSCQEGDEFDDIEGSVDYKGLVVNEISSSDDFVEIYNGTSKEVDLSGFVINDASSYDDEAYLFAAEAKIGAGEFIVVYKDTDFSFGISDDSGDNIYLLDSDMLQIDTVTIPAEESGKESYGRSTDGSETLVWFDNATPGKSNSNDDDDDDVVVANSALVINEASNEDDFVEIYNSSDSEISLAGYILSDSNGADSDEKYTFGLDEKITAKGFALLKKDEDETDGDGGFDFGLGGGDKIQLFNADGELEASLQFPDEKYDSYGCVTDGDTTDIGELKTATPGVSNGTPAAGGDDNSGFAVIVNEVSSKGEPEDWIELYNRSNISFDLGGYTMTDDLEDMEGAVTFAAGTTIEAGGYLVFERDGDDSFGFGLSDGDVIYIVKDGETLTKSVAIAKEADEKKLSWGRQTDGAEKWVVFTEVSKNASNDGKILFGN